jgi:phosphoribosylformylglycinamidine synthase
MAFGYDPDTCARDPYQGAKGSIKEALAKFACLGGDPSTARLSLQEYFERTASAEAWGKPLAALLGALEAQLALGVPAIGGKDSMSGSYRDPAKGVDLAVPPTLVAFAAGVAQAASVRSGALSGADGNTVVLLSAASPADASSAAGPEGEWLRLRANLDALRDLGAAGFIRAAYPVGPGGVGATLAVMAFGNGCGVEADAAGFGLIPPGGHQGSVLIELDASAFGSGSGGDRDSGAKGGADNAAERLLAKAAWTRVGRIIDEPVFRVIGEDTDEGEPQVAEAPIAMLRRAYEYPLARVYPQCSSGATAAESPDDGDALQLSFWTQGKKPSFASTILSKAKPLVVIPAFPGTNCEWDMERAFWKAGARTKIVVFRNRDRQDVLDSTAELASAIAEAHIVAIPGGFSAGDEPEGSGKFIANAFRAPAVEREMTRLLENRDGLAMGICNGFQALIKLGLVPYGTYREADETMPTLTFNTIGRHVSRMVRTVVMSDRSPWLALEPVGTVHTVPVSHGEGRIAIRDEQAKELFDAGSIPFCYADAQGRPTMGEPDNPNGSAFAIEGMASPDGRILGKMGHSERAGAYVHVNIPGTKEQRIFRAGVRYFVG